MTMRPLRIYDRPRALLGCRVAAVTVLVVTMCPRLCLGAPAGEPERLSEATCRAFLAQARDPESIRHAALRSRAHLDRLPAGNTRTLGSRQIAVAELRRALDIVLQTLRNEPESWPQRLCERLGLYGLPGPPALLTGYYQPTLTARRSKTQEYRFPLYGLPRDLKNPYYTRKEIDAGAIAGKADVIAWLNDPVDAFFLQIQGSGILELEDGSRMSIGYAGSNGRPYTSVGKLLIEQGKLPSGQAGMEAIKEYLRQHPKERDPVLQANERYIFFRTVRAGPVGSIGVILTPGRSVAADAAVYPAGGIGFLAIVGAPATPSVPRSRVVLVQDAGAAIKGPGRLDLFVGTGDEAGKVAGRLKSEARLYLFLPTGVL